MTNDQPIFRTLTFYLLAAATFLLDQWTKLALVSAVAFGHSYPLVDGFLHLTHVRNVGAAWSLFAGHTTILAAIAGCFALGVVAYHHATKPRDVGVVLGLGFLLGGALGNLADRAYYGYVRDMIELRWYGENAFPIMNVADIVLWLGILSFAVHAARQPRQA